ncbi:MAG: PA0069 family radical SAM protein [Gammaproteobacteria bacterium]|nr:PA0069 family radical SAM protein [Gammaproteobacteria bacterium]MCI0591594.1 PA0069 family radical SAM protein [Gammaproteobacteria bacterium]
MAATLSGTRGGKRRGRGALTNPDARYLQHSREHIDDGWNEADPVPAPLETTVTVERPKSIITRNHSPDVPFDYSINPYRGCEHGCIYCYARPTHAYMDLSPGLDFESKLFAKPNAAELLKEELAKPGYQCRPIALGTNTDPYQPIERKWQITRGIIEVLAECRHPMSIVTKSSLIERDIDLLSAMADQGLVEVFVSVTTLDRNLARHMEPRAAAPPRRLETLRSLSDAGIPTGVMVAPVIPILNDKEIETILTASAEAGVRFAGYVLLRLPHEVKDLFKSWLAEHEPLKAGHVMSMVKSMRGGKENDPNFGSRMKGSGVYAEMIRRRFHTACKRLGLNKSAHRLDVSKFVPMPVRGNQLTLF